uniref:Uncharacterized protein n=1 Tax=Oryza rufipogon TaxID=4529 RepID=A0A0E0MQF6_ORYRU
MLLSSSQSILLVSGLCLFAANERHSGCIQPEMAEALAIAVRCARRWRRVTRKLFWLQIA